MYAGPSARSNPTTAPDAVKVRSGPGTHNPSPGIAPKGAKGEVIGKSADGGWWVVKLPTDLVGAGQGWASADWVPAENAEDVPAIDVPPAPKYMFRKHLPSSAV